MPFRLLPILLLLAQLSTVGVALAQDRSTPEKPAEPQKGLEYRDGVYGRAQIARPEVTTFGEWEGTWAHVNRDQRWMLWFRRENGELQLRVQYLRLGVLEQFRTDWTGSADYAFDGTPGSFRFALLEADDDEMTARWDWTIRFTDSSIVEAGDLLIHRTGNGRYLALVFSPFERVITRKETENRIDHGQILTFFKVSKRLAEWDELF